MNNLSQVKMPDDTSYYFKDSEAKNILDNLNAAGIPYDNTNTFIEDENVQDALDTISLSMLPRLYILVTSGSSITITKESKTITGVSINGEFLTKIPEVGVWTITASYNGRTTTKTINISNMGKTYTVFLEYFSTTLNVHTVDGATVYVFGTDNFEEVATGGLATFNLSLSGNYNAVAKIGNSYSESISFNANTDGEVINKTLNFIVLNLTAPENSSVEITDGDTVIETTGTGSSEVFYLPNTGVWTATAELDGEETSEEINISEYSSYSLILSFGHICGAEWDGSSSTVLSRTDDSALFVDPDPYVADGNHPGSSPFDNLMPWSGMTTEIINGNVLVKIPKFWYKITTNGSSIKFQIADKPTDGFNVSPTHQDRGDGVGERDYIYVGRYHSISGYKSKSGSIPLDNITRATGRSKIKNLGTGFYLWDYATLVTIWLLYIVEFANWDSQACIGYGCGNGSGKQNTGASNSMPYHTGTMQTSRTTYGVGCQYRGIEDLWGNVYNWVDGITFPKTQPWTIRLSKNPSEFNDDSGDVATGNRPTTGGYISSWKQPSVAGYDWAIYPGAVSGSNSTYVPDGCYYKSSGRGLYVGGRYIQGLNYGLFSLFGTINAYNTDDGIGVRMMYLPSN